jgi:prefoldin subunit 5
VVGYKAVFAKAFRLALEGSHMEKDEIRDYELDIIVKAWRDEKFRQNLLKNPKKAIEDEFSIKVPAGTKIFVHEESEDSIHLIVPAIPSNFSAEDLSDEELRDVIGGVLASGHFALSNAKERTQLKALKKENDQLKDSIDKLKHDLAAYKKSSR